MQTIIKLPIDHNLSQHINFHLIYFSYISNETVYEEYLIYILRNELSKLEHNSSVDFYSIFISSRARL